jgi:hypothetical protein
MTKQKFQTMKMRLNELLTVAGLLFILADCQTKSPEPQLAL